jgi:hypothetical protein
VAVVSTRVDPLRLPPTIKDAPTSEITAPKPAMTAASMGKRASFKSVHTIWGREAPRARSCRRNLSGICWTAASVSPMTMGAAITSWAMIIAVGV